MNKNWIQFLSTAFQTKVTNHQNLQAIIENIGWLFFDKCLRMGVGLFLSVWIARYLGPTKYGQLGYAYAFISMFSSIAVLGLDGIVVRELIQSARNKSVILGTTFVLKLIGAAVAFVAASIFVLQLRERNDEVIYLVLIVAVGMFFQAFDTIDILFQSELKSRLTVYAKNTAFLLAALVKISLILFSANLIYFALATLLEVIVGALLLFYMYRRREGGVNIRVEWSYALYLVKSSWPLLLSGMFVLITMNIDKILIGEISGNREIGLYSIANQLSAIWYMLPMLIGVSVAPALTREFNRNQQSYYEKLQKVYTTLTSLSLIVGVVMFVFADSIVRAIFGSGYEGAGEILSIHILGAVFVFHVSIRTRAFIIEDKQKYISVIAAFTAVVNVVLNLFLIKNYGALGAAYASLISWFLCAMIFPLFWRETRYSVIMQSKSFFIFNLPRTR